MEQQLKIALDVDGVLADFSHQIIHHANMLGYGDQFPKNAEEVDTWDMCHMFREVFENVCVKDSFWDGVPPLGNTPNFQPCAYVTARPIRSCVTKKWLIEHRFPRAKVVTVDHPDKKPAVLESLGIDVFIDDYYGTIQKLQGHPTILGLLFEAPYQRGHHEDVRHLPTISRLDYELISKLYKGWIDG